MEHVGGFVIHEVVQEPQMGAVIYDRGEIVQPVSHWAATAGDKVVTQNCEKKKKKNSCSMDIGHSYLISLAPLAK